ncbi:hypothetical protein CAPTEDRAFT_224814 [Capitella teleta]|uniref:Centrosomal protein POC5 n=1 Tax=Capitella teleta TaxID=283909 RepID=R7UVR9_CAPTE|nr:hypothetical protein CAPTEDRAFT_224814 [Capitella teleta]|eukprot:ELU07486.1 hypothetical protein CAPTEDRAFT_224814 [Capitella teleta]
MASKSVSSEDTLNSEPMVPPDSPGSSVSSRFQEEYEELLKYAVIVPSYENQKPKFTDTIESALNDMQSGEEGDEEEGGGGTIVDENEEIEEVTEEAQSTPISVTNDSLPKTHLGSTMGESLVMKLFPEKQVDEGTKETMAKEFTITFDPDLGRMEDVLDKWTNELKRNVLGEFSQSKIHMLEQHRQALIKEQERNACENTRLQDEVENLKELLHTYEKSIERKDQIISNLTQGLQKQKERHEKLRTFCEWKIKLNDQRREVFASALARQHHERKVTQKCWVAWHSVIENKWRQRVEKACQAKAEEVCLSLTNDYESKIKSLNEALEAAREEVGRLHGERDTYEETMKKAFMRGVCALNMEAMNMFHESADSSGSLKSSSNGPSIPPEDSGLPMTLPQEAVFTTEPPGAPLPRVINASRSSAPGQGIIMQSKPNAKPSRKTINAKVSARVDSGRKRDAVNPTTLAPPMTSVVVERHHAVTKQTIGHATAAKFPAQKHPSSNQVSVAQHKSNSHIAGQVPIATPNVQTVKVVE